MNALVSKLQRENLSKFMADGPRLRYGYNVWVEAKDSKKGRVMLGGLGGCGVGTMWLDMDDHYKTYPNFADVPEVDAPLGPF